MHSKPPVSIAFLYELRNQLIALTGLEDVIVRYEVGREHVYDHEVALIIVIGEFYLPYTLDYADFNDLTATRDFILGRDEIRQLAGGTHAE